VRISRTGLFHAKIAVEIGTGQFVAEQHGVFIFHFIIPFIAGVAGKGVLGFVPCATCCLMASAVRRASLSLIPGFLSCWPRA
jgi:fructose-specific phosphotransferase system IIC component